MITMPNRKLHGKLGVGLLIPAAIAFAAIAGGIEWAFASLGMMVLISIVGTGIYLLAKALRYSGIPLDDDLKYVTCSQLAKARPVSAKDKRLIIEHIDELFVKGQELTRKKLVEVGVISAKDKRLIMKHIDELFAESREQTSEKPF